jgi:endonuclease G, mitochondrial
MKVMYTIAAIVTLAGSFVMLRNHGSNGERQTSNSSTLAEIHSIHCLHGCPLGVPDSNDLIFRNAYTMSTNDQTKFADWVAYVVVKSFTVSAGATNRNWRADPWLDPDETLEPNDYKDAHAELETDMGHQAPLAAFRSTTYWAETNFLSNVTPQKSNLNQGPWVKLENVVRDIALSGATVYVLTGPLFERSVAELPNADESHIVPSGYWKVITVVEQNETEKSTAYIFDQDTPRGNRYQDHQVGLKEVAARTGFVFFPRQ